MPTVLVLHGIRFVIFYNDHSPPHVHLLHAGCELIVALETVEVIKTKENGFTKAQTRKALLLVKLYRELLLLRWSEIHEKEK
jgi:hypothetical protein